MFVFMEIRRIGVCFGWTDHACDTVSVRRRLIVLPCKLRVQLIYSLYSYNKEDTEMIEKACFDSGTFFI